MSEINATFESSIAKRRGKKTLPSLVLSHAYRTNAALNFKLSTLLHLTTRCKAEDSSHSPGQSESDIGGEQKLSMKNKIRCHCPK